jgi:hydroxymethylpyrimidine kinase / phosphomethylpyrimidine kinase / thiamine-phosphate diphosphorylase
MFAANTVQDTAITLWTVAGHDPSAGAGILADVKTAQGMGVYAAAVMSADTAQNTCRVKSIHPHPAAFVTQQWQHLLADMPPQVIKLGMLGEHAPLIADLLANLPAPVPVVCDPVMVATSGDHLTPDHMLAVYQQQLLPRVSLITPNRQEAEKLTGMTLASREDYPRAAQALLAMGAKAVLIKDGDNHLPHCCDYFLAPHENNPSGWSQGWLISPRQAGQNTHGSGCTLSAAIAAALAKGHRLLDAMVIGKAYVNQGIRLANQRPLAIGHGHGPLHHGGWPTEGQDYPRLSPTPDLPVTGFASLFDAPFERSPIGVYPLVDRAHWIPRLDGVTTLQLRIKDLTGDALRAEIIQAVQLAKTHRMRLFINDHWQLALELGAYGVHLGQGDLHTADLAAIQQAGLRLGVSTHCFYEVARAHALSPSYMAMGPVFPTDTKFTPFAPQGLDYARYWRGLFPQRPMVAIAGIFLQQNGAEVWATGVDGIAVVRDVLEAPDPQAQISAWHRLMGETSGLDDVTPCLGKA